MRERLLQVKRMRLFDTHRKEEVCYGARKFEPDWQKCLGQRLVVSRSSGIRWWYWTSLYAFGIGRRGPAWHNAAHRRYDDCLTELFVVCAFLKLASCSVYLWNSQL